jgi:hypothetical protein
MFFPDPPPHMELADYLKWSRDMRDRYDKFKTAIQAADTYDELPEWAKAEWQAAQDRLAIDAAQQDLRDRLNGMEWLDIQPPEDTPDGN